MNYVEIINLAFTIIFGLMGLVYCHFVILGIVGVFFKKKYPKTEKKLRYGCIIPARNEEIVVGNLIESIKKSKYPQDKLDIFVIAHNCTDKTAEVARKAGAIVYEYNNENEKTMGYAFKYLFSRIEEDYGTQSYDGFFLFNADNLVDAEFFDKMNDAFIARGQKDIITSFRNTKNFDSNALSALYGLFFIYACRLESRGRTALGLSTRVQGTGYVIPKELVKDGWKYVTLTEDWEFSADQIIRGNKICYCEDAMFYDEQPTKIKVMWRQRVRWAKGHLLVCITRFKDLMKALFGRKKEGATHYKASVYDISINILPVCIIGVSLTLLQLVLLLICPFFGCDLGATMWGYLWGTIRGAITFYVSTALTAIIVYLLERKRIKSKRKLPIILSIILWPIFTFIATPMEIVALFKKNLTWKPIPHEDNTNISKIEMLKAGEVTEKESDENPLKNKDQDNIA